MWLIIFSNYSTNQEKCDFALKSTLFRRSLTAPLNHPEITRITRKPSVSSYLGDFDFFCGKTACYLSDVLLGARGFPWFPLSLRVYKGKIHFNSMLFSPHKKVKRLDSPVMKGPLSLTKKY